jgi:hypothetical protein
MFLLLSARGGQAEAPRGHFRPAALPDPRAWLENRLGPLVFFEINKEV